MSDLIPNPAGTEPGRTVLGFSGSPRVHGNSDTLLKAVLSGVASRDLPCARYNLSTIQFQGCIGCERCRRDRVCTGLRDGMSLLYGGLWAARGLVLVCPTHNYNVTAWMKAFIDRLYCFYEFADDRPRSWSSRLAGQGRKAVIAAICEQESAEDMGFTMEAMRLPLQALGYDIVGELPVLRVFDKGKVAEHGDAMERARSLGEALADALR